MLTKEQIEAMHTLLVLERPMGTSVAAVDELCRLALLGLERDERQAVTSEQAAKDIKILEQIHAKSWDEAAALRHAAEALSERDDRAKKIGQAVLKAIGHGIGHSVNVQRRHASFLAEMADAIERSHQWVTPPAILRAIAAALEAP